MNGHDNAQRDFDSLLNQLFNPTSVRTSVSSYGVDIREDAEHFYVEAELPGFKKEDVNVTLEDQTLTITAERQAETKTGDAKGELVFQERRTGQYVRTFKLPPTVDQQKVDAHLADGVLTVTLNKREELKPRKIVVS